MRIIKWVATVTLVRYWFGLHTTRAMAWRPVFAKPKPQFIFDEMLAQVMGKVRRCRLMSESNKLQPF